MTRTRILLAGLVIALCSLPARAELSGKAKTAKELIDLLNAGITLIEKVKPGFEKAVDWAKSLADGKAANGPLRCENPDETLRTLTRKVKALEVPTALSADDARYKVAVTKDSPKDAWKSGADKLVAFNRDTSAQVKVLGDLADKLDATAERADLLKKLGDEVSSKSKQLAPKVEAAKSFDKLINESFRCAWKDLEGGAVAALKDLGAAAREKAKVVREAKTTQERQLKDHTTFLKAGFAKHGVPLPSDVRE